LARRLARRSSAAGSEDPAPLRYRQKNHRYKAVSGTAHGTLTKYRKFAAKMRFRGIVPASMISMPMSTARMMVLKPFSPVFMTGVRIARGLGFNSAKVRLPSCHIGRGPFVNAMTMGKGDTAMKAKTIGYWVTTAIVAFVLLSGGAAELAHRRETIEGMAHLGYPLYFTAILGFWKVLGGITLLAPRFPRLKEWAYAGAFFDLTGATASHAARGDDAGHLLWPLIFAILAVASWALRPQSRTLGALFSAKTHA
jgi:uncharacterized membrane protein YphA (DoxX/SURF4 family)